MGVIKHLGVTYGGSEGSSGEGGLAFAISVLTNSELIGKTLSAKNTVSGESLSAIVNALGQAVLKTDVGGEWTITEPVNKHFIKVNLENTGWYEVKLRSYTVYGVRVNGLESVPSSMCSYQIQYNGVNVSNYDYKPAYMDYGTGKFNYGDWEEDEFFMPRSCMLKYNGKVDYYLDENDETKKEDGTASDITDTSYGGNAMMEWGRDGKKICYKVVPDNNQALTANIYISDTKLDDGFKDYSFYDCNGKSIDHFYTPKYNGSNVSSKLRSMSGLACINSQTGATEATYADANNVNGKVEWDTEVLADRILINFLLLLMGCSTNTQSVYGNGHYTGGSGAGSLLTTGSLNKKGMFYGTNGTGVGVKVFGMENWWGNIWRRIRGYLNVSGTIKIKLTYSKVDGSTQEGYDATGSGYITLSNCTPSGTSGGYINQMQFNEYGMFAKTASGSDTTYYCDGLWFNIGQTNYAVVGGACNGGFLVGAFYVSLNIAFSASSWNFGAALSCKPLAA